MDDDATVRVERGRGALCALKGAAAEPLRARGVPGPSKTGNRFCQAAGLVQRRLGVRARGRRNLPGRRQDVAQCVDLDLGRQSEMVQGRPQRLQQNGIVSAGLGQKADVALAAGYGERCI
jgi:hypothetical protein